jgi:tetratricopeptide (TPR) repeat protein
MRRSCQTLCCSFALLLYPVFAVAQLPAANSLSAAGTVFADGGNARLQNVTVRLCDSGGRTILQSATSSSGQFNFNGLQAGTYLLELEAAGFQSTEVRLDLSFSSQSGLAIYLKPNTQNALPPGSGASISAHELSIPGEAANLYREGKKELYNENKAQEALVNFQKALAQAPEFYEARYQAGMAYLSLGRSMRRRKAFASASQKAETNTETRTSHSGRCNWIRVKRRLARNRFAAGWSLALPHGWATTNLANWRR